MQVVSARSPIEVVVLKLDEEPPAEGWPSLQVTPEWGAAVKKARKALRPKVSQEDLAAVCGLSQVAISNIENGNAGESTAVVPICKLLKILPPYQRRADSLEAKWLNAGLTIRIFSLPMFKGVLASAITVAEEAIREAKEAAEKKNT